MHTLQYNINKKDKFYTDLAVGLQRIRERCQHAAVIGIGMQEFKKHSGYGSMEVRNGSGDRITEFKLCISF